MQASSYQASAKHPILHLVGGGKQDGVETPDEWTAIVDYIMEPLVMAWGQRVWGMQLETGVSLTYNLAVYFKHQVALKNKSLPLHKRLKASMQTSGTVACQCCETWHLAAALLKE